MDVGDQDGNVNKSAIVVDKEELIEVVDVTVLVVLCFKNELRDIKLALKR